MEWVVDGAADDDWLVVIDDDDPPFDDDVLAGLWRLAAGGSVDDVGAVGIIGSVFDRRSGRMRRLADDELAGVVDVDCIGSNQFPMYRVSAVRATGVFEPSLFWGYDDLDYGLRLRRAGFRMVIDGDLARRARTHFGHLDGGTATTGAKPSNAWRRYYTTRNLIRILRKHGLDQVAWRRATAGSVARSLRVAARDPGAAVPMLLGELRGVVDGWTDRTGRRVEPRAATNPAS
jgi:GT2 family glycosyltransferase